MLVHGFEMYAIVGSLSILPPRNLVGLPKLGDRGAQVLHIPENITFAHFPLSLSDEQCLDDWGCNCVYVEIVLGVGHALLAITKKPRKCFV